MTLRTMSRFGRGVVVVDIKKKTNQLTTFFLKPFDKTVITRTAE